MGTGAIFVWSTLILGLSLSYGLKKRYPEAAIQAMPYLLLFAGNVFALVSISIESTTVFICGILFLGEGYLLLYESHKSNNQEQ